MEWPLRFLGSYWGLRDTYHTPPRLKIAPMRFVEKKVLMVAGQFVAGRKLWGLARLFRMQIKPFRIEQYFGKYEFTAKYLLSNSDAESRTIQELLHLEPGSHDRLLQQWCGYTESPRAPWLREAIAGIYKQIHSDDVLVLAAAEEAIFVLY